MSITECSSRDHPQVRLRRVRRYPFVRRRVMLLLRTGSVDLLTTRTPKLMPQVIYCEYAALPQAFINHEPACKL